MLFVYLQMFFICKIHIKCDHSLLALVEGFNDYPNIDFDKIYSSLFEIIDKLFNIMFVILLQPLLLLKYEYHLISFQSFFPFFINYCILNLLGLIESMLEFSQFAFVQEKQIPIKYKNYIMFMLSFQQQENILRIILDKESNKHCADCGSHTPTWASLDFGVFVCSNCSGAHRALGPTITRIKSTKLDQWNKDWVENMRIGNLEVNQYWEADSKTAAMRKPKSGASLDEHNRYVHDKYVKRKFVTDRSATEPLKAYKNGHYVAPTGAASNNNGAVVDIIGNYQNIVTQTRINNHNSVSLLDDQHQYSQDNSQIGNASKNQQRGSQQSDQFTDFFDGNEKLQSINFKEVRHIPAQTKKGQTSKICFDDLLKNPPLNSAQSQNHSLNIYNSNSYIPQNNCSANQQSNLVNQSNIYQHNYSVHNQFAHNPYIGYAPHHNYFHYNTQNYNNGNFVYF